MKVFLDLLFYPQPQATIYREIPYALKSFPGLENSSKDKDVHTSAFLLK